MKVWDLPTRLYHWLQAILFIGLAASGFNGVGPHVYLGLGLFVLVTWRMIWGIVGSETSRFTQFMSSPKNTILYLLGREQQQKRVIGDLSSISRKQHIGHNPAGAWMVIGLISLLFIQCLSGLILAGMFDQYSWTDVLLNDDVFDIVATAHNACARILVALVGLHLGAIILYKLLSKPLVWAMVTGIQNQLPTSNGTYSLRFASNLLALIVLIACVLVTMAIVVMSQV